MRPHLAEGYAIRDAAEADLPHLASGGSGLPLAALDLCRVAGTLWAGTGRDGRPVAHLAAGDVDGSLHILALHVAPDHRRHGLGTALLAAALGHARWAFYPAASAAVAREAPDLERLLAAHGFLRLRHEGLGPGLRARIEAGEPGRLQAMAKRL